eukprot:3557075-Alexandrium_andersonii.AAC.1
MALHLAGKAAMKSNHGPASIRGGEGFHPLRRPVEGLEVPPGLILPGRRSLEEGPQRGGGHPCAAWPGGAAGP